MNCKKKKDIFILDIREKERQRIAMEIHDVTIQHLIHLIHKVELSSLYIDKDPVKAKLELATVENGLHKAIDEMRSMVLNLHPIPAEDMELKDAFIFCLKKNEVQTLHTFNPPVRVNFNFS